MGLPGGLRGQGGRQWCPRGSRGSSRCPSGSRGVLGVSQGSIGGEVQVSQGVKRCVRGQGKSRGSKGLKGTSCVYQGVKGASF